MPAPYVYASRSTSAKFTDVDLEVASDPVLVKGSTMTMVDPGDRPAEVTGGDVVTWTVCGVSVMQSGSGGSTAGGKPICVTFESLTMNQMTKEGAVSQVTTTLLSGADFVVAFNAGAGGAGGGKHKNTAVPPAQANQPGGASAPPAPAASTEGEPVDDAAGAEGMLINASHDYNERTENDKKTTVTANDAHTIGSDHKDLVGIVQEVKIDGAQSYSIGADRDLSVGGNLVIEAASESIGVGGLRSFTIGGDFKTTVGGALTRTVLGAKAEIATLSQNVHVTGGSRVSIGGTRLESAEVAVGVGVLGASNLSVGGAYTIASAKYSLSAGTLKEDYASMSIAAGAAVEDAFAGAASLSVGGSLSLTGSVVSFVAMEKISIDAAGVTVTITPGSIEIAAVVDSAEDLVVTGMDVNE